MPDLLPRTLLKILFLGASVLVGLLIGRGLGGVWTGVLGGALLALSALLLQQVWRARELLDWLRGSQQRSAPRDEGFWGEVGYRIERTLRSKEQQLVQEKLRLHQFLAAIEASPNGVMLLDASDQIEWCNSVAAEHFGLDPVRDRRQRVTNLVRSPAFVTFLSDGRFADPVVFVGPSGLATLSVLVRPYGDGMKLVLTQDITERERAEGMRRDFVANVSHEIRTPLTVLAGFVETLASLPLSEVERKRVLLLMDQQTSRMQGLVGDLLTLAHLEGSPRPGADRWVGLAPVLRRAHTDAVALSAGRHRIEVVGGADAELAGIESELHSAISNLMNNAVRYTPEGGEIALSWHWCDDGTGEIEVSDTGIGIAREHLPRLTERFYRVDGSRSRDTGGTGLGLSIVKHVVQRHGGSIDVHSEPGKGSTFKLSFPAVRVRQHRSVDDVQGVTA
jgi:two-component system phosphate regulon sensor histidine kinase PhoR